MSLPLPEPGPLGPDPLIEALFPSVAWKVDWGLGRMEAALDALGAPHRAYRCLHVGGTNGKGSVASTWASVLRRSGARVGLYTSPHLCSFRERVVVDGRPVAEDRLLTVAERLAPLVGELGLSFFEAATLLAFETFRREGVEIAAIEVGLGGRLDATNVVDPLVTAITNVAMDHQDFLGDTLAAIAGEKAGIIKHGVPVVTAERRPELLEIFRRRADAVGAPLTVVDPWKDISDLRLGPHSTRFTLETERWGALEIETPLLGAHQATNAALAIRALELALPTLKAEVVVEGVGQVEWPGRVQIRRHGDTLFVFDVAHNTAGARALVTVLRDLAPPRPMVLLTGILGDKDWARMLPPLTDAVDLAVFTTPVSAPTGRAWDPNAVADAVRDGTTIHVEPDFHAALERARSEGAGGTVIVTGSCYTVGDALQVLGLQPFRDSTEDPEP